MSGRIVVLSKDKRFRSLYGLCDKLVAVVMTRGRLGRFCPGCNSVRTFDRQVFRRIGMVVSYFVYRTFVHYSRTVVAAIEGYQIREN